MTPVRAVAPARTVVAVVVLLLLAACAGSPTPSKSTPSRTPSATPSPTKTAAADTARVVIDGRSVTVYDDDGSVELTLPYTVAAEAAASRLSDALDATAQTSTVTTDQCYQELDESSWGGLHIFSTAAGLTRPASAQFYVTADAAKAAGGLPIELPSGQAVGAAEAQVLDANTKSPSFSDGDTVDVHYDIVAGSASGDPNEYYGAVAEITGGRLTTIDSPIYYSRPC